MATLLALVALLAGVQAAPLAGPYTITVGSLGALAPGGTPDDTPASSYIDKDGSYYYQQAHALYGATDGRSWSFFTGANMDDAKKAPISSAVNPANSLDSNSNTTWRCNNSPTGLKSTQSVGSKSYAQRNYCDLAGEFLAPATLTPGMWLDPDTGDWYGLVHNEFTPQPFADGLHYDAIDYAVSKDQGNTWSILAQVITSPFSTLRGDTTAFPQNTYHYGDGDPRLLADSASGYFYVWYGSRIVNKGGSWVAFHEHVARAPISGKMAPGTWQKWYNGAWSEPGLGGKESNIVPVKTTSDTGYTSPDKEYKPTSTGTVQEQISNGLTPPTSPLFVMDVSYNAHLGLYIGEPQVVDQSGKAPQEIYATDDLTTQKWTLLGNTGSYTTASWYRWFLDPVSKAHSAIIGKDFRAYCYFGCSGGKSSEYINLAISGPTFSAIDATKLYTISAGGTSIGKWSLTPTGDGAYVISSGTQVLGVDSTQNNARAWGTNVTIGTDKNVGRQWWIVPLRSVINNAKTGKYRIINRFSGLALAIHNGVSETVPVRTWSAPSDSVGGGRTAAEQEISLT